MTQRPCGGGIKLKHKVKQIGAVLTHVQEPREGGIKLKYKVKQTRSVVMYESRAG